MPNARETALNVIERCFKDGAWSSQLLEEKLKYLSDKDASLAFRLSVGVLQNYMLLDYYIDSYAKNSRKLDLTVRNILRLGAYQLLFTDRIPVSAAVNESVELCRKSGFSSACGLVNAVLRKIAKKELKEPEDLSVRYSHPAWFVNRMLALHGEEFTRQLLSANNTEPPVEKHTAFNGEEYYVQDMAAYTSVKMAAPVSGMKVIDTCAAPGGKSFTAGVMMENEGSIVSCDIHEKKLRLISSGAERLGIRIITTRCLDAREYVPEYEAAFDLVIADVPCSGLGVIRKKPEIRFKKEKEIAALPGIQKAIIANVSRYVKPGGTLLYSTCTILPEENGDVARSIGGFEIISEKTFYPHIDNTDGFYACVLKKNI